MRCAYRLIAFVTLVIGAATTAVAQAPGPLTAPPEWRQAPRHDPAEGIEAEGLKAVFFDGPEWKGKPTRVFAWIGVPKVEPGAKVPGIVLVHGGGGTAFAEWVRLWVGRGYAAIAMDTCGCVPKGSYGKWERHAAGGPPGWGGFEQAEEPAGEQWPYHAAADVVLAHSLLRSLPEVDPDRVGLTGISWGGYLTCLVAGLDDRFRFAVPVYGCGFLGENSVWAPNLRQMGPKGRAWLAQWDPSHYLPRARMPLLWVTGTNDFAYPLDSLQKSYRAAGGPSTLCIRLRMPHGHGGAGENPAEIARFADAIVRGGPALARVTGQGEEGGEIWASFEGGGVTTAELLYTKDTGAWPERKWEAAPAALDAAAGRASATVPEGATVSYLNLIDAEGRVVSAPHQAAESAK